MNTTIDFDVSTAGGQMRLMAVSMGLDSEAYLPRPLKPEGKSTEVVRLPLEHPLIGVEIRATWLACGFNAMTVGKVIAVERTHGGSLRLALMREDGTTQRCYTQDRDWRLEPIQPITFPFG